MKKFIGRLIVFVIIALMAWGISLVTTLSQPMMFAILMAGIWLIVVPILMIAPHKDTRARDFFLAAVIVSTVIAGIFGVSMLASILLQVDAFAVFEILVLGTCLVVPRKTASSPNFLHHMYGEEKESK